MIKYRRNVCYNARSGFTTIYLLMIMSALTMAIVTITNAACGYAARSIVDNVCACAGRSVLSEYQTDLYERYGIFALRADESSLSRLSDFYISRSLDMGKALVRPVLQSIEASAEAYPALDVEEFGVQVRRLAPGAAVMKGDILEFILGGADTSSTGLTEEVHGGEGESVEDISGAAEKEFRKDKDKSVKAISKTDYRELPSQLLGYHKRISTLLSGGIKDISFNTLIEDEYIIAVCSNKCFPKDDTYLDYELEYVIYGRESDALNIRNIKLSLFAIRFAVNEAKYYSETGEALVATVRAVAKSVGEVRDIIAGKRVDNMDYNMYLRILLALIPRNEKLARMMDIIQLNICKMDNANFSFRNYAYGFELNAVFDLKGRNGDVLQAFTYR